MKGSKDSCFSLESNTNLSHAISSLDRRWRHHENRKTYPNHWPKTWNAKL